MRRTPILYLILFLLPLLACTQVIKGDKDAGLDATVDVVGDADASGQDGLDQIAPETTGKDTEDVNPEPEPEVTEPEADVADVPSDTPPDVPPDVDDTDTTDIPPDGDAADGDAPDMDTDTDTTPGPAAIMGGGPAVFVGVASGGGVTVRPLGGAGIGFAGVSSGGGVTVRALR
jgi:hypothetical protein